MGPIATRTRLIGRKNELDFFEARLDAAMQSEGSIILLSGDAGIGKSRLVREFLARERNVPVVTALGQCYEYLQSPFGPFVDIFTKLSELNPKALSELPGTREVLESVASAASSSVAAEQFDKRRLFQTLRQAMDAFTARTPAVLALDDIHWADGPSLELLQFLADSVSQTRIVLVATYRSGDQQHSDMFRRTLAALAKGRSAFHRELHPLTLSEVRTLLRACTGAISQVETRRIASVSVFSEGNPLLAQELFKSAGEESPAPGRALKLPLSIREAVLARVGALSESERQAIVCASAIGRRFSPHLLAEIASQPIDEVLRALNRAAQELLIEDDPEGGSLRFRHELTRQAVYGQLLQVQARALHQKIAGVLERQPQTPQLTADLAYHYWMAADTIKASDFNEEAGDRAFALFGNSEAVEHYDRALQFIGDSHRERHAAINDKRGNALYQLGMSKEAVKAFEAARIFYDSERMTERVARLSVKIATLRWSDGREVEAIEECRHALASVDASSQSYFRANAYLGYFLSHRDPDAAMKHFTNAESFQGDRQPQDALVLYQCRAVVLGDRGDVEGAVADFRRAIGLSLMTGDHSLAIRCLGNLGLKMTDLGERQRAVDAFEEAVAIMTRESLWDIDSAVCLRQYAWACLQFGELAAAHRYIVRSLEYPTDSLRLQLFASQAAMVVGLRTLDEELVGRVADRTLLDEAFRPGNESMALTALPFAELEFANGRTAEGIDILHRVVASYAAIGDPRDNDGVLAIVAEYASEEDADVARSIVKRYADESGAAIARAHLLRYDAVLSARRGEAARAAELAGEALEIYHRVGWKWHEAQTLEIAGKLGEAMAAYEQVGDKRSAQRLHGELNPVNRRGRAKSELTEREFEIAQLAAAGKSNKEIAEALTLSPRTVETHLATIFGKLSVRTRAELIAKWRDLPAARKQASSST
jgi:DNA-binding NarL/FixJ family response regulator